jgi:hypothetical protein
MTNVLTGPSVIPVLSTDTKTIGLTLPTGFLNTGETVSSISTKLTLGVNGDTAGPALGAPTLSPLAQTIVGSSLTVGSTYTLWWILTLSSGNVLTVTTTIVCPQ